MTEPSRKHFFRDEDDNRTVVETQMTSTGEYRAHVVEAEEVYFGICGYGHSRLAAIADLQQQIEDNEEG